MATADAQSLIAAHHDAVEFGQAGFDAAQGIAGRAVGFERVKRGRIHFDKGADAGAAQSGDMAVTAQNPAHIAGNRADIGAFTAFGLEYAFIRGH